jgi:hypothetical protein
LDATISLQSNAHALDGRSAATASKGSSVERDLEGAISVVVMGKADLGDGKSM